MLTWVEPDDTGGYPVTGYKITPHDVTLGTDEPAITTPATGATVTGLMNDHTYTFSVRASNGVLWGAPADSNAVTPKAGAPPPDVVSEPVSDQTGGSVTSDPSGTRSDDHQSGDHGGRCSAGDRRREREHRRGHDHTVGAVGLQLPVLADQYRVDREYHVVEPPADHHHRGRFATGGETPATLLVFRTEGSGTPTLVPACLTDPSAIANPDPCIPTSSRVWVNATDVAFTVVTSSASTWNVAALSAAAVSVADAGYTPKAAQVAQGQRVEWAFSSSRSHSVTESTALGPKKAPLFDSGARRTGTFAHRFLSAGAFAYRSTVGGDSTKVFTGSIGVPMAASATSLSVGGPTTLTWSVPTTGWTFDVKYRFRPAGSGKWGSWANWKQAVTTTSSPFTPTRAGTYDFQARVRNAATGRTSGFSPDLLLTVV